jgi:hypothetical protein
MSEKQIKECIPYTESSNQNRSNKTKEEEEKKKKENEKGKGKEEEEMHSFFSRIKCQRRRRVGEKTGINNETKR